MHHTWVSQRFLSPNACNKADIRSPASAEFDFIPALIDKNKYFSTSGIKTQIIAYQTRKHQNFCAYRWDD